MSLNTQNQALLNELKKWNIKNKLFQWKLFGQETISTVEAWINIALLTDAQLAAADVTIERIEAENFLRDYIHTARHSYNSIHKTNQTPDWLLKEWKSEQVFELFFANINSETNPKFLLWIELFIWVTLDQAKAKYESWKDLNSKETLKQEAREKVRHALDLKACLSWMLKFYWYSWGEIGTILEANL